MIAVEGMAPAATLLEERLPLLPTLTVSWGRQHRPRRYKRQDSQSEVRTSLRRSTRLDNSFSFFDHCPVFVC
jgi:hypothetical protein